MYSVGDFTDTLVVDCCEFVVEIVECYSLFNPMHEMIEYFLRKKRKKETKKTILQDFRQKCTETSLFSSMCVRRRRF